MNRKTINKAFVDTVPVLTGYLVLGIGFGIILKTKEYGVAWAFAMSFFIYAGSMQYVAISLLTSGASLVTTALTTLMVNARHLFYGISMLEKYRDSGWKKPYLIFALTDETYSLVCDLNLPTDMDPKWYCFLVSLFDQIYWVSGCVIGSLLGSIIRFDISGIDFALTALFLTVFVEQWLSTKDHRPALIGVGASVLCLFVFGAETFLIPSMLSITLCLMLMQKQMKGVTHE